MPNLNGLVRVAALFGCLTASTASMALSQIVDDNGEASGEIREGIVAVPLPPLPSTVPATPDGAGSPVDSVPQTSVEPAAGDNPVEGAPASEGAAESQPSLPATSRSQPSEATDTDPASPTQPAPPAGGTDTDTPPATGDNLRTSRIFYGDEGLPKPVRDLRARLMEVARTGIIEKLRPFLQTGENETILSFGGSVANPIEHLKGLSGDPDGIEILAILLEVLEAGHIVVEPDSEDTIYVWPYFAQTRLDTLTPSQKVELFELVTAGDYEFMADFGAYNFYRLGITPDGELAYFVTGD